MRKGEDDKSQFLEEYKILAIGEPKAGKTSLLEHIARSSDWGSYSSECAQLDAEEEYYSEEKVFEGEKARIWFVEDCRDPDVYSAYREQMIRSSPGFLLIYSVTSRTSFDYIKSKLDAIGSERNESSFRIFIVATNYSKRHSDHEREIEVTPEEGRDLAESWDCPFFEVSGERCENDGPKYPHPKAGSLYHDFLSEIFRGIRELEMPKNGDIATTGEETPSSRTSRHGKCIVM